jgi:hypothetical protein
VERADVAGLDDRLERLEQHVGGPPLPSYADWPREDQVDALLMALRVHRLGGSSYSATRREIELLDALIDEGLVENGARELVEPMALDAQYGRERWLRANWREHKAMRELDKKRLAWGREHGIHEPIPSHLLPGGGG